MAKLMVLGIGYKALDEKARQSLLRADFVVTSGRLYDVFTRYPEFEGVRSKTRRIDSVDGTMRFLHESFAQGAREIVLLASGDPFFFGIGRRAVRDFGPQMVDVIPDISSVQYAFSRIKEPWDDALFISFHGGPNPAKRRRLKYQLTDLPSLLEEYDTVAILTDRENNPSVIAGFLAARKGAHRELTLYVCEKLGYDEERIVKGTPDEIAGMSFDDPNVVIVKRTEEEAEVGPAEGAPKFGLREEETSHSRGLITKDEVRAVTVHRLRLPATGVFWDIGAGSGAISVEAARLCPNLEVFAIEKDEEQLSQIEKNRAGFHARNVRPVHGEAPGALTPLPSPDRVFIGGSGDNLQSIIEHVRNVMRRGIVVINAATLETLNEGVRYLEENGFSVTVSQVSVSRSKVVGGKRHMAALNPVFVITGERG